MDITKIPIEQLYKDREESIEDIGNCNVAISLGIYYCRGDSVKERRNVNQNIVVKIDKELKRRKDGE